VGRDILTFEIPLQLALVVGAPLAAFAIGFTVWQVRRSLHGEVEPVRAGEGKLPRDIPSWLWKEAGRRMRLVVGLTIWAATSGLLLFAFSRSFGWLYGKVELTLFVFLVYLIPVGLGLAVAREGSRPFRMEKEQPIGAVEKSTAKKTVPADAKTYKGDDLTASGFPFDYQRCTGVKSSAQLQEEYLRKRESKALNRFEKWRTAQFSFYNVLGV
jgi:hypothetical protein